MARFRSLKKQVRELLGSPNWEERLAELDSIEPKVLTGPLFALLLDRDEQVRLHAITAFGPAAKRLADQRFEEGRILMRNFMWHMNEESGNLGWGIAEAMAEAMVCEPRLAKEFNRVLGSYIFCDEECDGNFLDHPPLRRGVFWGLGRLAGAYPHFVEPVAGFLMKALQEEDNYNRAYAAWVLGIIKCQEALPALRELANDTEPVTLYRNRILESLTVACLVSEAIIRIEEN
ncbi:MAG: DVU0298 family protein [Desulfovibrio sp.]